MTYEAPTLEVLGTIAHLTQVVAEPYLRRSDTPAGWVTELTSAGLVYRFTSAPITGSITH